MSQHKSGEDLALAAAEEEDAARRWLLGSYYKEALVLDTYKY